LFGNKKKARKDFRCFCFDKTIDSDVTNYKDLVEEIVNKYPPGYLEVTHVQYYDHDMKAFFEVLSDQDLLCMFKKNSKTKVVDMFISYCDPSKPFEPIKEYYDDVQNQIANNANQDKDRYLCNPLLDNEHVGVDEEVMYLGKKPIEAATMDLIEHREHDKENGDEDEDEDEAEAEAKDETEDKDDLEIGSGADLPDDEELVGDEADHIPNLEYDKEDHLMEVGSTYPNMAEFKIVLSQHAIKHQYEFNTKKSAPSRFRAYCSKWKEDKCTWGIHASSTDDLCTGNFLNLIHCCIFMVLIDVANSDVHLL
jgi:hypothetical protein